MCDLDVAQRIDIDMIVFGVDDLSTRHQQEDQLCDRVRRDGVDRHGKQCRPFEDRAFDDRARKEAPKRHEKRAGELVRVRRKDVTGIRACEPEKESYAEEEHNEACHVIDELHDKRAETLAGGDGIIGHWQGGYRRRWCRGSHRCRQWFRRL